MGHLKVAAYTNAYNHLQKVTKPYLKLFFPPIKKSLFCCFVPLHQNMQLNASLAALHFNKQMRQYQQQDSGLSRHKQFWFIA